MLNIKSIDVVGHIPFITGGIMQLSIQVYNNCNIVTGANGVGKSSLFKLMSPAPKTKPEFKKGSCKLILEDTITGDVYEITSDFSKGGKNHSFIKNDTDDLNVSGTATVQQELMIEYLNWTPVVNKLVHGEYKLCEMSKIERRELFIKANPVDIGFVLEHYKKIHRELRAAKSQLKLLTTRKLSLLDQILPESNLKDVRKESDILTSQINIMDKLIVVFEQKVTDISNRMPEKPSESSMQMVRNAKELLSDIAMTTPIYEVANTIQIITNVLDKLNFMKERQVDQAITIKEELDMHSKLRYIDINETMRGYETKIAGHEDMLSKLTLDDSLPIIDREKMEHISNNTDKLDSLLNTIRDCGTKILPMPEIESMEHTCQILRSKISEYQSTLSMVTDNLDQAHKYLDEHRLVVYPMDCTTECSLRTDMVGKEKKLSAKVTELERLVEVQDAKIQSAVSSLHETMSKIEPFTNSIRSALTELRSFLDSLQMNEYILDGSSLNEVLSSNPSIILNRIRKLVSNSTKRAQRDALSIVLSTHRFKLKTLQESKDKTIQFTTKTIISKEVELSKLNLEIASIKRSLNIHTTDLKSATEYKKKLDVVADIKEAFNNVIEWIISNGAITFYRENLIELNAAKASATDRLIQVSSILKEQDSYITRLEGEILPNIKEIEEKIYEYELVTEQLSPDAIPHTHIRSFTNRVIAKANSYLKVMWIEPLKIHKYNKGSEITFDFKVTVGDHIVPEIKECSDGQKNAINLAFQLGIYTVTGWNNRFPIFFDEISANMTEVHQQKVLELLISLLKDKKITHMFLIDHQASLMNMPNSDVICLSSDPGSMILPEIYNEHVRIL